MKRPYTDARTPSASTARSLTHVKGGSRLVGLRTMHPSSDLRLKALESAPLDSWVALSEDESKVVAAGSTYDEVVRNSEIAGVSDPVLIKTPKIWMPFSV